MILIPEGELICNAFSCFNAGEIRGFLTGIALKVDVVGLMFFFYADLAGSYGRKLWGKMWVWGGTLNQRLAKWVRNKYKRFRRKHWYYSLKHLKGIAKSYPNMFEHWKYEGFRPC